MLGNRKGTAQAALAYGANDLDGTVPAMSLNLSRRRCPKLGIFCPSKQIQQLFREAGRDPIERETRRYNRVNFAKPRTISHSVGIAKKVSMPNWFRFQKGESEGMQNHT